MVPDFLLQTAAAAAAAAALLLQSQVCCLQGQLTVANGVLFGATASSIGSHNASLFAINTIDGSILNAVTLDNYQVQNAPSIVDDVLYQGTGMPCMRCTACCSGTPCMHTL